jgi:tetratricopeptide (TPR) repeat protein
MERMHLSRLAFTTEDTWTVAAARFGGDAFSAADVTRIMQLPPAAAEARARHVLATIPDEPQALRLLAAVLRRGRRDEEARPILERLARSQPQMEFGWRGLGLAHLKSGERAAAIAALERAVDLEIRGKDAWYALGDLLDFSAKHGIGKQDQPAGLKSAELALRERRLDAAEHLLRRWRDAHPRDPAALKLSADILILKSRWPDARSLLENCLAVAPDFTAARFRYATMLIVHGEYLRALPQLDELAARDAVKVLVYRRLKAEALALAERYDSALAEFESVIADAPPFPGLWYQYGRMLRLLRRKEAASAFERAVEILPCYFEAWFALATLRSFRWNETLIAQISAQLARPDTTVDDRALMYFVLGRALDSLGRRDEAFENCRAGNEIRRRFADWDAEPPTEALIETKSLFGANFFRARAGAGAKHREPIFIVGMPRAGSTLVEQILSSHSAVEGLGERPDLWAVTGQKLERVGRQNEGWPSALRHLGPADLRGIGEEYMARMRALRKSGKAFFTDKQPSNYQLIGLIHLALPEARIVDVRRHPLDCGLSCFRHYFPAGQPYTCDLVAFGRRYAAYAELMAHFDELLPGKVHRVMYENLIGNFEVEVRRLLAFLGLPFEEQCLRFYESSRMVQTLSFEQVAMPLYQSGVGQWRHYERWLDPLKAALGDVLQTYPEAPKFYPRVQGRLRKSARLGEAGDRYATVRGLRQIAFESTLSSSHPAGTSGP